MTDTLRGTRGDHPTGASPEATDLAVLIPCYDDAAALRALIDRVAEVCNAAGLRARLVVVDDGSPTPVAGLLAPPPHPVRNLDVLRLTRNLGHQRAIAIGLAYINDHLRDADVLVMDADGEDDPADIPRLVERGCRARPEIVFAQRTKRNEGPVFRLGYGLFKRLFAILTGKTIDFGNFCFIPCGTVRSLANSPEIWTHFAAGVMRTRLPFGSVPTVRAPRSTGESRMNLASLILHGLAAISLFADLAAVRVLLFALASTAVGVAAIGTATAIRFFTDLAVPGWATNLVAAAAILIMQVASLSLLLIFVGYQQRSTAVQLPSAIYEDYLLEVTHWTGVAGEG